MENTRNAAWDDPRDLGRRAREVSGLEFLRPLIAEKRQVPIGVTLGFELVEDAEGRLYAFATSTCLILEG